MTPGKSPTQSGTTAIGQTLAGPQVTGRWIGIQNCVANVAGIVGPVITGFVVDRTGQYYLAFMIAAAIAAVGIIGWSLMITTVAPLNWNSKTTERGAPVTHSA